MDWLSAANTWVDVLLVIAPVLFILYYTYVSRWWKNTVGRALVALMMSLSLIPSAKIIVLLAGVATSSNIYTALEVGTKGVAVIAVVWCIVALWRVRKWRKTLDDD